MPPPAKERDDDPPPLIPIERVKEELYIAMSHAFGKFGRPLKRLFFPVATDESPFALAASKRFLFDFKKFFSLKLAECLAPGPVQIPRRDPFPSPSF